MCGPCGLFHKSYSDYAIALWITNKIHLYIDRITIRYMFINNIFTFMIIFIKEYYLITEIIRCKNRHYIKQTILL